MLVLIRKLFLCWLNSIVLKGTTQAVGREKSLMLLTANLVNRNNDCWCKKCMGAIVALMLKG